MTDIQFQNAFTASLDYLAGRVKELHPELANKAFSGNELVVVDVGSGMMSYLKGMVQWASARNPNYKIIAVDKCPPIDVLLESEEVYKGRFAYMQSPIEKAGKQLREKGVEKVDVLTLINPEFFYSRSGIISAAKLAEETGDVMLARVQSLQISMRNEAPLPNPLELGELTRSTILMGMADGKNSMNAIAEELEFFGYKVLDKTPNPFAKNLNERGTYYQFSPMFSAIPDAKAP